MTSNGGLEDPIMPAQPPSNSKRKAADEPNSAAKRPRKDAVGASGKRKLRNGEEQPSGLVIVRAGSSRPPSAQSMRPPPPDASSSMSRSPPPMKKFKSSTPASSTTTQRGTGKGKQREELVSSMRPEGDVDEDVRRMESEADDLRRQSQATSSLRTDMSFSRTHNVTDHSIPLEPRETPRIEKNRSMRGEGAGGRGHGRRSSLSMRGKRVSSSFESTGVITTPHSSVDDSSFYKHIDADLPDSARARQLLIWCGMRTAASTSASTPVASSSKKQRGAKNSGKDPPPLSNDALELFNGLIGDTMKMLAEKQINTNVFSPAEANAERKVRPNEQNAKNRERHVKFSGDIERTKAEDAAWSGLDKFYNSHQAAVMREVEYRRQASAKAKGKQRADNVDEWGPRVDELPDHFREGVPLARSVLLDPPDPQNRIYRPWDEEAYRIDDLHQLLNASSKAASVIETDLDRRFGLLSLTLQARSSSLPPPLLHASTTPLSAYLPAHAHAPSATTDPQDLFRALSRVDMARKPAQVGDAARRAAREVQRAQAEGGPGLGERRLTGVPPPTPRKPPGTPRRATTPGRGR